jgi:hypothetical protein
MSRFHQQQPQLLLLPQANCGVGCAGPEWVGCCGLLTWQLLLGQRLLVD